MNRFAIFLTAGLFLLSFCLPARARVDWSIRNSFTPPAAPLDLAGSVDGKWVYVLNKDAKLRVYSAAGKLEGEIPVDPAMDRITAAGLPQVNLENKVFLSSSRTHAIQEIMLDFSVRIPTDGAPFVGPADAPVTLVEFSDFECPYCAKAGPLLDRIIEMYPEKVKVVFKQYPLSFHRMARPAALAAIAAQAQGKFWQYHDLLFENQKSLGPEQFLEFARRLQLDIEQFTRDMKSRAAQQKLSQDMLDGRRAGVRGTPTLFINGRRVKKRSVPAIKEMIDQELARIKTGKN